MTTTVALTQFLEEEVPVLLLVALGAALGALFAPRALRRIDLSDPRLTVLRTAPAWISAVVGGAACALATVWFARGTSYGGVLSATLETLPLALQWDLGWYALVLGAIPAFAALLIFAALSILLSIIDVRTQRLPDRLVLPGLLLVVGAMMLAAAVSMMSGRPGWGFETWALPLVGRTLGGAGIAFLVFYALALISPRSLGGGDVKLAPVIGAVLGFFGGWIGVGAGLVLTFVLGAVWGLLLTARGASREEKLPFAPVMFAAAWLTLLGRDQITLAWYALVGA